MYLPAAFAVSSPAEVFETVRRVPFGHLVSAGPPTEPRLESSPLPFVVDDDLTILRAHFARGNPHWKHLDGSEALMIVTGPDAYVSPRWYPSKAEHGKVVPTWNYEVVHLHGTVEIHDDPAWKRALVTDLTRRLEGALSEVDGGEPWEVSDAPAGFVDMQLKAIVGIQLNITAIEAKRKLSQNRSASDREGALEGLGRSGLRGAADTARLMRSNGT